MPISSQTATITGDQLYGRAGAGLNDLYSE